MVGRRDIDGYARRLKCRELLFGKGRGKMKNLSPSEQDYIRAVHSECYDAYLTERITGKSRYELGRFWRRNLQLPHPISKRSHFRRWKGSQRARWIRHDLPLLMKQRIEAITEAAINPTSPTPGHAKGCPCHRCRTYADAHPNL